MAELEVTVHSSIDGVNRNQWNNLVRQSEHGTVFHRHEWLEVVEREFDCEPLHAVVTKGGNPVAVFPNFLYDIPLGELSPRLDAVAPHVPLRRLASIEPGYGGPIVATSTEECLDLLFDAIDERVGRGTVYHAVKMYDPSTVRYAKYLVKRGFAPVLLSCRFVVDLDSGWDQIEGGMHKTRRYALRSGRENSVEVEPRQLDAIDLEETYESYRKNMRRVDGDSHPETFFEALATDLADRTVAFEATVDDETVGRFVHLVNEEQSSLLYYLSAIGDESHFEYNPSELLHGAAMQWGMDNGVETYDFGATGADFRDGIFQYKEKYGGQTRPILTWRRGVSTLPWLGFKAGSRLYQKNRY